MDTSREPRQYGPRGLGRYRAGPVSDREKEKVYLLGKALFVQIPVSAKSFRRFRMEIVKFEVETKTEFHKSRKKACLLKQIKRNSKS